MYALMIAIAVQCYSLQDMRSAQCDVACKWAGYDSGYFDKDKCQCVESKEYERLTHEKRLHVDGKRKPFSSYSILNE